MYVFLNAYVFRYWLVIINVGKGGDGKWKTRYIILYSEVCLDIRVRFENGKVTEWSKRHVDLAKLGLVLYFYVMDIDGCTLLDKNENVFTDLDTYEKFKETGCFFVIRKSFYKNSVVNNVAHWVASVQKFLPRFDFDTSTMQHEMISNH